MKIYAPMCRRCKEKCKQRADLGTRVIKCPSFNPKNTTSRGDGETKVSLLPSKN